MIQIHWLAGYCSPILNRLRRFGKQGELVFWFVQKPPNLELEEVLKRPEFDKYLSKKSRLQFLTDYRKVVFLVDIIQQVIDCRDPKDNKFLEAAINANVSHLISGDDDLLILHPSGNLQIVTPADFLLL